MAPEVIRHDQYDFKVDIWGLGIVLYQLCNKKLAFKEEFGENEAMYTIRVLQQPHDPVPAFW